jgi:DNA-binding LacI/PurR family transcriptional regulator
MEAKRYSTITEQVCTTLREGMLSGRWSGELPGRYRLARELGVNHKTVEAAARRLEQEKWLVSQGGPRRRRIVLPQGETAAPRELRVRILPYDRPSRHLPYLLELLDQLRMAGFAADYSLKMLADLGMDAARVARFVKKTPADAWVVVGGSCEVLEWFSRQELPVLALFGRSQDLPIAATGPKMIPAMVAVVRRLVALGHRRIVMISPTERRKPTPARTEQRFLDELEALGIATGSYHLPDWEHSADGLREGLDELFRHTPPTALIFSEPLFFVAAQQHLARRGIHAPENVSLICADTEPCLEWCQPAVSHFTWDPQPVVRRVVQWAKNVAAGKKDIRQVLFEGTFVEGGMIAPPPEAAGHS